MKTQDKQILSMLQAYNHDMVLKAFELYKNDADYIEKDLSAEGWLAVSGKPENKEFYHINGKYFVQSDDARERQIKDTVKQVKVRTSKNKQSMDLKQVSILCPECQGKMYKQNVCGGCAAGKAGYKIRLICENNPDHEVLL